MRGFPLWNFFAVIALLALVAIPLRRISAARPPALPSPSGPAAAAAPGPPVSLRLRFVHAPREAALFCDGKEQPLEGQGLERQATLPLRDGALEVEVKATWADGTGPTLIELRAAPEGQAEQLQNLWSEETAVDEWLRFHWRTLP